MSNSKKINGSTSSSWRLKDSQEIIQSSSCGFLKMQEQIDGNSVTCRGAKNRTNAVISSCMSSFTSDGVEVAIYPQIASAETSKSRVIFQSSTVALGKLFRKKVWNFLDFDYQSCLFFLKMVNKSK